MYKKLKVDKLFQTTDFDVLHFKSLYRFIQKTHYFKVALVVIDH